MKDIFSGNFNVPVADRTRLQKSAYVKLWRLRKGLSIDLEGNLLHKKKKIVKKSDVKRKKLETKIFIKNKSGRCRKLEQEQQMAIQDCFKEMLTECFKGHRK